MLEHILLVGEDPLLLRTRAMLLSDWQVSTGQTREAQELLQSRSFDAVILGQLVPAGKVAELIELSKSLRPAPAILLIRYPEDRTSFDVETHTTDQHQSPGWLRERVAALLKERVAKVRNPEGSGVRLSN
jgi:DNA-binding NtrC family response regulator